MYYLEALLDLGEVQSHDQAPAETIGDLNSTEVALSPSFQAQLQWMYYLSIFWLSAGATNISNIIACFALYWADVWKARPSEVGVLLSLGELSGIAILFASTLGLGDEKNRNDDRQGNEDDEETETVSCGKCFKMHSVEQPALQIWATVLINFSSAMLGCWLPSEEATQGRGFHYALHVLALLCASIGNSMCQSSGCENMVSYLPKDLFLPALSRGYMLKRVTNLVQAAFTTFLYALSPQFPFILVCGFYAAIYLPSMIWGFEVYFQLLSRQRLQQTRIIQEAMAQEYHDRIEKLAIRVKRIEDYYRDSKLATNDDQHAPALGTKKTPSLSLRKSTSIVIVEKIKSRKRSSIIKTAELTVGSLEHNF